MIREVIAKEKEVSAAVKQLLTDLANERQQHEAEVEERNEIISKLKEELQEVRSKSAIETKYMQKEARAHGQSLNRIYNHQSTELEQQIRKACPIQSTPSAPSAPSIPSARAPRCAVHVWAINGFDHMSLHRLFLVQPLPWRGRREVPPSPMSQVRKQLEVEVRAHLETEDFLRRKQNVLFGETLVAP